MPDEEVTELHPGKWESDPADEEVTELRPQGWESDPADEYFKLSTLDYCVGQVYTNYAVFFNLLYGLETPVQATMLAALMAGLEITLAQCRQLCGVLEEYPDGPPGTLCWHKKRESTVQLNVQILDGNDWEDDPEGEKLYPSSADLQNRHYTSQALGDLRTWTVAPMTYGEKPEAQPDHHPVAAAFKATFHRGGLVFMMHLHHYANDVMGWAGMLHQLAENCAAFWRSTRDIPPPYPPWDPACLDTSRVTVPDPPESLRIDGPVPPRRHPGHRPCQALLFHLPRNKAAALKEMASPSPEKDGEGAWVSTYDASMALIWRVLTRHRARLFNPDPNEPLLWGEAVDMRRRLVDPPVPPRMQGNVVFVALSSQDPEAQLTVEEVVETAPLSRLALYIRHLTNTATQSRLQTTLQSIAPIRDKSALFLRTDSFPPLSNFVTDWRAARPCDADFGFGTVHAFRFPFPFGTVTPGLTVVYPPRDDGGLKTYAAERAASRQPQFGQLEVDYSKTEDEGNEFVISVEREIVEGLLADEEWSAFFEFRGLRRRVRVGMGMPGRMPGRMLGRMMWGLHTPPLPGT
ncbi:hypothetical protein BDW74DRAFT_176663 [Aspergillus multicolor]|uniref:uncharacterized protein n=1 Tax=Aspergillus multicolor TaxID=41759 RepID=UPI003CCCCDFA